MHKRRRFIKREVATHLGLMCLVLAIVAQFSEVRKAAAESDVSIGVAGAAGGKAYELGVRFSNLLKKQAVKSAVMTSATVNKLEAGDFVLAIINVESFKSAPIEITRLSSPFVISSEEDLIEAEASIPVEGLPIGSSLTASALWIVDTMHIVGKRPFTKDILFGKSRFLTGPTVRPLVSAIGSTSIESQGPTPWSDVVRQDKADWAEVRASEIANKSAGTNLGLVATLTLHRADAYVLLFNDSMFQNFPTEKQMTISAAGRELAKAMLKMTISGLRDLGGGANSVAYGKERLRLPPAILNVVGNKQCANGYKACKKDSKCECVLNSTTPCNNC